MERKYTGIGNLTFIWTLMFFSINLISFCQEENTRAPFHYDQLILKLPKAALRPTMTDTILPTIGNSGQGLLHYEWIFPKANMENSYHNTNDASTSVAPRNGFNESDLKILKNQLNAIDEQYHYLLQQQKKIDNLDLNLGEVIRGFYQQPIFK